MHQRLQRARDVTVVDEEILFEIERCVKSFKITRPVILHAMPQNQILRACGGTNRIGLHKPHPLQGILERCWFREVSRDCKASQIVEIDWHRRRQSMLKKGEKAQM